jgi:hypothetical protein
MLAVALHIASTCDDRCVRSLFVVPTQRGECLLTWTGFVVFAACCSHIFAGGRTAVADSKTERDRRVERVLKAKTVGIETLLSASRNVSILALGSGVRPIQIGRADPELDAVHFVQVGRSHVIAGTIDEFRDLVIDLGFLAAEMERDMLEEKVEEGRRQVERQTRRLA